jgi:hypothetical protein
LSGKVMRAAALRQRAPAPSSINDRHCQTDDSQDLRRVVGVVLLGQRRADLCFRRGHERVTTDGPTRPLPASVGAANLPMRAESRARPGSSDRAATLSAERSRADARPKRESVTRCSEAKRPTRTSDSSYSSHFE